MSVQQENAGMEGKTTREPRVILWSVVAGLTLVGFLCGLIWYPKWYWQFDKPEGVAAAGTIAGALFSALAFVGVIATILLQRHELRLQRQELADTRAEFKEQNATMASDLFERAFFQLLQLNRDTVRNMEMEVPAQHSVVQAIRGEPQTFTVLRGQRAIGRAADRFGRAYHRAHDVDTPVHILLVESNFIAYEEAFAFNFSELAGLDAYFQTLDQVLRFVSERCTEAGTLDAGYYYRIIRSQLSSAERLMVLGAVATSSWNELGHLVRLGQVLLPPRAQTDLERALWGVFMGVGKV